MLQEKRVEKTLPREGVHKVCGTAQRMEAGAMGQQTEGLDCIGVEGRGQRTLCFQGSFETPSK